MSQLNTQWVNQLTAQINSIPDCKSLAALLAKIEADINAQIQDVLNKIKYLESLIIIPTDLASVITWIKNHIAGYYAQYLNAIQLQLELVAALNQLLQAIEAKSAALVCNLTIPTVTVPTTPTITLPTTLPTPPTS